MAEKTTAAVIAFKLIQAALAEGVDPAQLLPFDVPPDGGGLETRVPHESLIALWEKVMRLVRDPRFPIRAGSRLMPKDYDPIGFACMTRATFGEGLAQAVRFSRIWTNASTWTLRADERQTAIEFSIDDPERLGVRCGGESLVAQMIHAGRALTGLPFVADVIRFRHARPKDTSEHERFFQGPVEWGAPRTEIVVGKSWLSVPLLKADVGLAGYFERHAAAMLERFAAPESLQHRLRTVLVEQLRSGLPTLEATAPLLAVSTRTLRRRLQEEGTTFHDVLDEVRCNLAKRYLGDPELPVGSVAFLLGFSEASAFHRAFKRWTGTTPLGFRRSGPSAAA